MKIIAQQWRDAVVEPVLKDIGLHSEAAVRLLLGTIAAESGFKLILQLGNGPARSLFQIEPFTMYDVLSRTIHRYPKIYAGVMRWEVENQPWEDQLAWNMAFATCVARLKYYLDPERLPNAGDIIALSHVYKRVYNSNKGASSAEQFLECYNRLVGHD